MNDMVPQEIVEQKIYIIRGRKVMLSADLAELYGVEPKVLIQAVKRNSLRFPLDFMFQLTWDEENSLRSQIVTLKKGLTSKSISCESMRGKHIKYLPYAFTEYGVAMLSSVLNSESAIQVNISIMRAFGKLREILSTHKELAHKLNDLEHKFEKHDGEIKLIFQAIREMMTAPAEPPPEQPKRRIGFL
jgi:hypothetical protein